MTFLLLFLLFVRSALSFEEATAPEGWGIFKIPELIVQTNSSYLTRNAETRLECRISGQPVEWASATLEHVLWLRDGVSADVPPVDIGLGGNFQHENTPPNAALFIVHSGHHSEGEYQCSAIVRHIKLSSGRTIDSRLVSAPLKLRRARITKFERYEPPVMRVRQGQVARLPCYGLPDVIPAPPEIWFEKLGNENLAIGRSDNERYMITAYGLQIALSQPNDAGHYFCVVRNTFTNQTRKAPRPIVLVVDTQTYPTSSGGGGEQEFIPRLVFPEVYNYSEPLEFHVVTGESVTFECVIWNAKVVWDKSGLSITASDESNARVRQIWGNLRIKQVRLEDAGDYVCRGIPLSESGIVTAALSNTTTTAARPHVIYRLFVHAPTNVRLTLTQSLSDKSWQLSCYAYNLYYEIPMVYVNGLALIDAMKEMGVPPHTNFFTNPINITFQANNALSGSVQCISRPAMEEAEIYGASLERGRATNLFVDDRVDDNRANSLISIQRANNRRAPNAKDEEIAEVGDIPIQIERPLAFVAGDNSVRIQWRIVPHDVAHTKSRIQNFFVEIFQRKQQIPSNVDEEEDDAYEHVGYNRNNHVAPISREFMTTQSVGWQTLELVPPHVRALTLQRIVSDGANEFQLRVTANFENLRRLSSQPTPWLRIHQADNDSQHHDNDDSASTAAEIGGLQALSSQFEVRTHAPTAAYNDENRNNVWLNNLKSDYLKLHNVSVALELIFGALCIAAILLLVLSSLLVLHRRRRATPRRRQPAELKPEISFDFTNKFFLKTSSPTGFFSGDSIRIKDNPNRPASRDERQQGVEQNFVDSHSPLGCYNNLRGKPYAKDYSAAHVSLRADNKNQASSSLLGEEDSRANSENYFTIKRKSYNNKCEENGGELPNFYGNLNVSLDKCLEEIYDANKPSLMRNGYANAALSRNATLSRNNSTLKRVLSNTTTRQNFFSSKLSYASRMEKEQPASSTTIVVAGCNPMTSSTTVLTRPASGDRLEDLKSPSLSILSTSMYGSGMTLPYEATSKTLLSRCGSKVIAHDNTIRVELRQKCHNFGYLKSYDSKMCDNNSDNSTIIMDDNICDTQQQQFNNTNPSQFDLRLNGSPTFAASNIDNVSNSRLSLLNFRNDNTTYDYQTQHKLVVNNGRNVDLVYDNDEPSRTAFEAGTPYYEEQITPMNMKNSPALETFNCGATTNSVLTTNFASMSTFKCSPAPSLSEGSSSGYNSSSGGNDAMASALTLAPQSHAKLNATQLHFGTSFSANYGSTLDRRKKNHTVAILPTCSTRNCVENNKYNNNYAKT